MEEMLNAKCSYEIPILQDAHNAPINVRDHLETFPPILESIQGVVYMHKEVIGPY
jgi:hypothetical protein